jgi:hypothetical protein
MSLISTVIRFVIEIWSCREGESEEFVSRNLTVSTITELQKCTDVSLQCTNLKIQETRPSEM